MFIHSFLNGLALVYFETTASTMFLMNYDVSDLPYIYIFTAIVSMVIGYFYTILEDILDIKKLLYITLIFVLGIVIFFFVSVKFFESKILYMLMMTFKDTLWIFVGIEFGILIGIIFNIRQGKRLFGFIMSGEIIAGIIGGLSIGYILKIVDTINLLLISSVSFVLSLFLLIRILDIFSSRFHSSDAEDEELSTKLSYTDLLKNRYYLLFFVISVLSFFVFYFIDYIFYYKVEEHYPSEKDLAAFFGIFFAMLNTVNLFSSLFLSAAVLSRFGVIFGLAVIPAMAIVGTSSLFIISSVSIAFLILVFVKLLNEVFDISILTPTFRLLYQAIPTKQRVKVLAFRETIIEPLAMGIAGVFLLLLSQSDGIEIVCYIIIFFSIIWLYYAKPLKDNYITSLEKMIDKRKLFTEDMFFDGVDEKILLKGISTDNEVKTLYYLNLLESFKYADINQLLIKLLSHKSDKVRIDVLQKVSKINDIMFLDALESRLDKENNTKVFKVLLITYSKLGKEKTIDVVTKYIDNENTDIQTGAIISLYNYCGIGGIKVANDMLIKLFDLDKQLVALNILGDIGIKYFKDEFQKCLQSNDFQVRKLAIEIVGKLKLFDFVPTLLENISDAKFRNITIYPLEKFSDEILDDVMELFENTNDLNTQIAIVKILGNMKNDEAHQYILKLIKRPLLTDTVLKVLYSVNYNLDEKNQVTDLLVDNIKNILSDLVTLNNLDKEKYANSYLIFKELIDKKINNIFLILGFSYSKKTLSQIKDFSNSSLDYQAFAIELMDNILPKELKKIVLPILDNNTLEDKLSKYKKTFLDDEFKKVKSLSNLITNSDIIEVLKVSLIYEMGKNMDISHRELIKENLESKSLIMKETAQWSLQQLDKKG